MTKESPPAPEDTALPKRDELLVGMIEKGLIASRRNVEQFARLAALARAIGQSATSEADRTKLLVALESIADEAQTHAQHDVELLEGLHNGQIMKQHLQRSREAQAEADADAAAEAAMFVAPSNTTRH